MRNFFAGFVLAVYYGWPILLILLAIAAGLVGIGYTIAKVL